jgi:acyl-CoA synthetase (AMP-forming)/AMP-acid ligase II
MGGESRAGREGIIGPGELARGVLSVAWRLPSILTQLGRIRRFRSSTPLSLGRILERSAVRSPDRKALLFEDRSYTHEELNGEVNRYAHELASCGVSRGDTVHVLVDNRPELLMLIGALAKLGAVASLLNPRQRGAALRHSLGLAPARHHIVGEELLGAFEEVRDSLPPSESDALLYLRERGKGSTPAGYLDLEEAARRRPRSNPASTTGVTLGDPYALVFTSGTTGLPKAAIQTHRRWISGGLWFGRAAMGLKPRDVYYCPLPFCHTNALHVAWGPAALAGAALAIRRRFSASAFWGDVRSYEATVFIYIGEICRYLMNRPAGPGDRDHAVRRIIGNGLRHEIWKPFKERFGIRRVHELYGAAEAPLAFVNLLNLDATAGACLMPHAVVRYDVEADRPVRGAGGFMERVAAGETGLLLAEISESLPFAGYTDEAESEKKILRDVFRKGDAWFDSGDLVLSQGFRHVRFVDRLGDTFRWKGENVSTTEVERVVNSLEQVAESAAYGVLVPGTEGRAGMVAIVPAVPPASFDLAALARALQKGLPPYAVPRFVRLTTRLDTTATLKIKKSALKKEGFDSRRARDPLFVLLPGGKEYEALTPHLAQEIAGGEHRF